MDSIRSLYIRVTDLHRDIDKRRYEADLATQNSLNHSLAEEYDRATNEATLALRCTREIEAMDLKVIETEQQIMTAEKHIAKLQQQEMALREENYHHISHITRETKQKLDDITRQLKALRG